MCWCVEFLHSIRFSPAKCSNIPSRVPRGANNNTSVGGYTSSDGQVAAQRAQWQHSGCWCPTKCSVDVSGRDCCITNDYVVIITDVEGV